MSEPENATPVASETPAPVATPATTKGLQDADYNPRRMVDFDFKALKQSIKEFGDLSCVVRNIKTGNLVGGHRRKDAFVDLGDSPITITERYDQPNNVGTIAVGYIDYQGERFKYREVDWELQWEMAANVAANKIQGSFDTEKLGSVIAAIEDDIRSLTGHTEDEIKNLLQLSSEPESTPPADSSNTNEKQSYELTLEQAEVVTNAVAKAKTLYRFDLKGHEDMTGTALFYIARDWLAAQTPAIEPIPNSGPDPSEFDDAAAN